MKRLAIITSFLFISIVSINAQGSRRGQASDGEFKMPTAKEMADIEIVRQTKALGLTPEQVEKIKAIDLKYAQQRLDLFNQAQVSGDMSGAKNQMQGIRLAQNNDMKEILTPEQYVKLIKFNKKEDSNYYYGSGARGSRGGF